MEYHRIANIFPLMEGEAFQTLVEDIRKHGLLEPIVLHESKILDGRNRYRACMEAGVAVRSQEWQGEAGSIVAFVWSKNAERRQLTTGQRAVAGQALMPELEKEAKARYEATVGRPAKSGLNSDQISPELPVYADASKPKTHRHPRAADYAAKLAGVDASTIYQAKRLSEDAKHDDEAAELLKQVQAGTMPISRADEIMRSKKRECLASTESVEPAEPADEDAAALRRRRSPIAFVAPPPREDANEASKARYISRPVRVFADYLAGLRLDMERQGLTITDAAVAVWWDGVESREWAQIQESIEWFTETAEPLMTFVHRKMLRKSIPPMVAAIEREHRKYTRRKHA